MLDVTALKSMTGTTPLLGGLLFVRCHMERSAADDDLVDCPNCRTREFLFIRWIPDIDHKVHERTEIGCYSCGRLFGASMDKWCYAEWNAWACEQWKVLGRPIEHSELYKLLHLEAQEEQIERTAAKAVTDYLTEHFANRYPLAIGDRFKSKRHPKGFWSLISIRAVYGTNTGPFCMLTARKVLPSGSLCSTTHEFWSHLAEIEKIRPFWKAHTWSQVHDGDSCILNNEDGTIDNVDLERRIARVNVGGSLKHIHNLRGLQVPISRFEGNDI
jgi:hypothetical protein